MSEDDIQLAQAKQYINQIDFSSIIGKMVQRDGWLKSDALQVCALYRKYLFLRRKYSHQYQLPPTKEIDTLWHYHILDTKKYREDCDAIFGEYHDHYPYFGFDEYSDHVDLNKAFLDTQRLYSQEFDGEKIYTVRNVYSKTIELFKRCFKA